MGSGEQGDLFGNAEAGAGVCAGAGACAEAWEKGLSAADALALAGLYSDEGVDLEALPPEAGRLFELSANAFSAIIHARASELPIAAQIARFGEKVLAAADAAGMSANAAAPAARGRAESAMRRAAELAAEDRGDRDACAVHEAAHKARHEICRLRGLLRFAPGEGGAYVALCSPDHFVLPALGGHFKKRFGGAPWAIIDEKRRLRLSHAPKRPLELFRIGEIPEAPGEAQGGKWESLWRQYHKAVSNEDRRNPELQRQFLPQRYWKHLTEMQGKP